MDLARRLEASMVMDDATWARHANPWSGWTRFPILPLLALTIWSRDWIGWWCLVPLALLLAWIWINPRAFPPPKSHDHWMTQAVLGERVWLACNETPIPDHHRRAAFWINCFVATGLPPLVYGLWALDVWPTVYGVVVVLFGKLWFLDRMVWLWRDTAAPPNDACS